MTANYSVYNDDSVCFVCNIFSLNISSIYCEIIYIRWTFNFVYSVGRATNLGVYKHVQCCKTMKFHAHGIK